MKINAEKTLDLFARLCESLRDSLAEGLEVVVSAMGNVSEAEITSCSPSELRSLVLDVHRGSRAIMHDLRTLWLRKSFLIWQVLLQYSRRSGHTRLGVEFLTDEIGGGDERARLLGVDLSSLPGDVLQLWRPRSHEGFSQHAMIDDEIDDYSLLTKICPALASSDEFMRKLSRWLERNAEVPDPNRTGSSVRSDGYPLIGVSFGDLGDFKQTFIFDSVGSRDLQVLSSGCDAHLSADQGVLKAVLLEILALRKTSSDSAMQLFQKAFLDRGSKSEHSKSGAQEE